MRRIRRWLLGSHTFVRWCSQRGRYGCLLDFVPTNIAIGVRVAEAETERAAGIVMAFEVPFVIGAVVWYQSNALLDKQKASSVARRGY